MKRLIVPAINVGKKRGWANIDDNLLSQRSAQLYQQLQQDSTPERQNVASLIASWRHLLIACAAINSAYFYSARTILFSLRTFLNRPARPVIQRREGKRFTVEAKYGEILLNLLNNQARRGESPSFQDCPFNTMLRFSASEA